MYQHVFRTGVLLAAITASAASPAWDARSIEPSAAVMTVAQNLMAEISDWLAANFELPGVKEMPAIEFVPSSKLADLRYHNYPVEANSSRGDGENGEPSDASRVS